MDTRYPVGAKGPKQPFLTDNLAKDEGRGSDIRLPGVPEDTVAAPLRAPTALGGGADSAQKNVLINADHQSTPPFQIVISSPPGCDHHHHLRQSSQLFSLSNLAGPQDGGAGPAKTATMLTSHDLHGTADQSVDAKNVESIQQNIDSELESICMSVTRHALE